MMPDYEPKQARPTGNVSFKSKQLGDVPVSSIIDLRNGTFLTVTWYYWIIFGGLAAVITYLLLYYNNNIQPIIGFEPGTGAGYWFMATVIVWGIYLVVAIGGRAAKF